MNEKAVSKKSKHSNDSEAINTKAIWSLSFPLDGESQAKDDRRCK